MKHRILLLVLATASVLVPSSLFAATWTNWSNGQSLGSFFGIALGPVTTVAVGNPSPTPTGYTVQDQFDGSSIDASKWQIQTPFSDSSVTVADGAARLSNRGRLLPTAVFGNTVAIYGRFKISADASDAFKVVMRTDGTFRNDLYRESATGFVTAFGSDAYYQSANVYIQEIGGSASGSWTGALAAGVYHDFRIVDDGTTMSVYLNDMTSPKVTVASPNRPGNKIIFYNRERLGTYQHRTELDFVRIESPYVRSGPIVSPLNGSRYYLLSSATWSASEARATELGGHLATVHSSNENTWIYNTFQALAAGSVRGLWIGLNDLAQPGTFQWSSGQPVAFTLWHPGEPNNIGLERFVYILGPHVGSVNVGKWNNLQDFATNGDETLSGVVEVKQPSVSWATPTQVAGPLDVSTAGTLKAAFNFVRPDGTTGEFGPATVNGVTFQQFDTRFPYPAQVTGDSVTVSAIGGDNAVLPFNGLGGSAAPFASLSPDYRRLLSTAFYNGNGQLTVTATDLVPGQRYQVQLFVNDSRTGSTRSESIIAGNMVNLVFNTTQANGGLGQFVIGEFTADASAVQAITMAPLTPQNGLASQINAFQIRAISDLQLLSVVSRKTHGWSGTFDVSLDDGSVTECRSGGIDGDHTVVFKFTNPLTRVASVNVTAGVAAIGSSGIGADSREYIVNLTKVADAQTLTVTLGYVEDAGGVLPTTSADMTVLLGDVNGNRSVNASDVSQTKVQSGRLITSDNFRADASANGQINGTDISLVKSRSGFSVP